MQRTSISWVQDPDTGEDGYSWNPVTGCTRAGPECFDAKTGTKVCYAERLHHQQAQQDNPPEYVSDQEWTADNADDVVTIHEDRLDDPLTYSWPNGAGKVFVCSMSDLFHDAVPATFIRRVIAVARQFPESIWICLTKRPARAVSIDIDWPANVWLGTSVGSGPGGTYPDTTHRLDELRDAAAETLWVSFEPLIEPVGDVDLTGFDWAVVGGESRPDGDVRREMEHDWACDILRQCRAQDVAYHFKQSSAPQPGMNEELTVERDVGGQTIYEQRRIREWPALPEVTVDARDRGVGEASP